jgi:hypothetical protein
MLDSIETDVIYNHEKYGEVLVTGVARMYEEYTVSEKNEEDTGTMGSVEVKVFFNHRYDGYGGMDAMPSTQPVMEFAKMAERVKVFEYASDLCEGEVDGGTRRPDDDMDVGPDEYEELLDDYDYPGEK